MTSLPAGLKQRLLTRHIGDGRKKQDKPHLHAMVGIPASGKTTFLSGQSKNGMLPQDHYYHNPDVIMTEVPDYKRDLKTLGPAVAKDKWELPCREFADNELFPEALRLRLNIVMDMGMCRPEIIEMVKKCQSGGYYISLHVICCSIGQAIERASQRTNYVPPETIRERALFLADNIKEIITLSDDARAYDNTSSDLPYKPIPVDEAVRIICTCHPPPEPGQN